ncbi:MAG: DUF58 domain-containing protein, partial [Bacteroidales bacterium]
DLVAVQVYDHREKELPAVGLMKVKDAETQADKWIDTSSSKVRNQYKNWWNELQYNVQDAMKKSRVDFVSIATDDDYVLELMKLFKRRH